MYPPKSADFSIFDGVLTTMEIMNSCIINVIKNLRENERGRNCGDFGSSFIKIEKKLWPGDNI